MIFIKMGRSLQLMFEQKISYRSKGNVYLISGALVGEVCTAVVRTSRIAVHSALRDFGFNVLPYKGTAVFLEEINRLAWPAVLLFDTCLNDWSGINLQFHLNQLERVTPIIFMGEPGKTKEIVMAMRQGATDFFAEPFSLKELCVAVEQAMSLNVEIKTRQVNENAFKARLKSLTTREREICFLIARGYGNIEIAALNGSTAGTVKIHRGRVLYKMGADTLSDLITQISSFEHSRVHLLNLPFPPEPISAH
jgi:FixJ family two-component response regulator